ncbi:hypothetical protein H6788_01665 [Candidatus Nomurabacteria bacterium]|nr:hypothetical protein [Candidatus Nomurabacteria bacterium]MCB9819595.1 hypothetical protein [Candidatus Nomurabacteria bacterium]
MRILKRILFLALAIVGLSQLFSWYSNFDRQVEVSIIMEKKYITLADSRANAELIALRNHCGDAKVAVSELQTRIGEDDGEGGGISYDELVGDILDYLLNEGTISRDCLFEARNSRTYAMYGPLEGNGYVLLTNKGDVAIGVYGQATMPWSMVNHPDGWLPDVLVIGDNVQLAIKSPSEVSVEQASIWNRLLSVLKEGRG